MKDVLVYLFWPNPGNASYDSPKSLALLILCAVLILGSFVLSYWRKEQKNQSLRKLTKSWPSSAFWFGFVGLILIVSRVESIQFIAMRVWWGVWLLCALLYIGFQLRRFKTQFYQVIPAQKVRDPRTKYLPKKRRK